jgi:excisionase family DNA binding protein
MPGTTTPAVEAAIRRMNPVRAPQDQRESVAALLRLLEHAAAGRAEPTAYKLVSPTGEETELPESVFLLLERIIEVLARGDAITVVPVDKELTTQQAANILNVSRQYLVRLLDDGRIPFHKTGTHRRVRMEDLLAFKRQRDRDRMASLDDLAQLSQDFGGYEEISTDD